MLVAATLEQCWHPVPGGTGVAALRLIEALSRLPDVSVVGVSGRHREPPPAAWRPGPNVEIRQQIVPSRLVYDAWLRLGWPRVERTIPELDIVHAMSIFVPPTRRPLVVTLHDLAFLRYPEMFTRRGTSMFHRGLAAIIGSADLVLCSSLATMADAESAGIPADLLRHVPLGAARPAVVNAADLQRVRERYRLPERYVLAVGTLEPRKNLPRLLQAFATLGVDDLDLVVVGPTGWGDRVNVPARTHATGFVDPDDLGAVYAGAAAFCYPSLFEGFGLPVLEAMSYGLPVVTSAGTSTAEVAGDVGYLVDPLDVGSIADGLRAALHDGDRRRDAGLPRAAEYTWAATAQHVLGAYHEVLG